MPLVKICAVTTVEDAMAVKEAGADLIGVIFATKSKRCVTVEQARKVAQALHTIRGSPTAVDHSPRIDAAAAMDAQAFMAAVDSCKHKPLLVGVFQNQEHDEVNRIAREVDLDFIQLHGNEEPHVPTLLCRPVIRAIGVDPSSTVDKVIHDIQQHLPFATALLLDTKSQSGFGGTGEHFDWTIAGRVREHINVPIFVAGGLVPENVHVCIAQASALGVDVAGGVERSPGVKDHQRVREFITIAKTSAKTSSRYPS